MRSITRRPLAAAACLVLASTAFPHLALAGMGTGASAPKYTPEPCQGDACRGDDTRSGLPCQGLLCSFSSAKSMQQPVTAAQAAEAQRAAAAAEKIKPIDALPAAKPAKTTKRTHAKHATKTNVAAKDAPKPAARGDAAAPPPASAAK